MADKKALLVVSFGTSYPEVIERCIAPVERAISETLPEFDFYRAFTSGMIIAKLKRVHGIEIFNAQEALTALAKSGYTEIVVMPTHILPGVEYHDLKSIVDVFTIAHPQINVYFGQPMLYENEDYPTVARALSAWMPETAVDEVVVLMGHGTEHFCNSSYFALQHYLDKLDTKAVYVANVEAPPVLDEVIAQLKAEHIRKVYLMPFMLVAGDHARNDMAGEDKDSWLSILSAAGFEVEIILKGLGESPDFADIYRQKALKVFQ